MDERKLRSDWVEHVRDKQAAKRWAGARIWRVGRLYEVLAEDPAQNLITVHDVAAQEKENWDRLQFCSIGFRVEATPQPAPTAPQREASAAPERSPLIEGLRGLFSRLIG